MLPITVAIPVLFAAGVAFGYAVVLPAALHFFQNFNSGEFNVLVQASQHYKFGRHHPARDGTTVPGAGRNHGGHARRHRDPAALGSSRLRSLRRGAPR
jgi:Sec-independent protein translocase protein (TatC)